MTDGTALDKFNALWFAVKKHVGVDPECAHWADEIRLELAKSKEQWRTIESAPRDGTPYLAWAEGREVVYTWWAEVESCLGQKKMGYKTLNGFWANFGACINPTHWLPLPAPPPAIPSEPNCGGG